MQSEFGDFAKSVVLYCHITTHITKDPDQKLLSEKGGRGFPTMLFMDEVGDVLYRHQGARKVEDFQKSANLVAEYMDLKKQVDGGDEQAAPSLLIKRMQLGHLTYKEAKRASKKLKDLSEETSETIDSALFDLQIVEAYISPRQQASKASKLGKKWYAMARKGKIPQGDRASSLFWSLIHHYGVKDKNRKAVELAESSR